MPTTNTLSFAPEIALTFIGDNAKLEEAIAHFGADSVAVSDPENCYTVFTSEILTPQSVHVLAKFLQSSFEDEITTEAVIHYYLGVEFEQGDSLAAGIALRDAYKVSWTLNGDSLEALEKE